MIERLKPSLLEIDFVYEPSFTPPSFPAGVKVDEHPPEYVRQYALFVSCQWEQEIAPKIIDAAAAVLSEHGDPFWDHIFREPITCHILRYRIMVEDHFYIEATSHPLSIWSIPPDERWQYLPFYARLIHELIHKNRFNISEEAWKKCKDDISRENRSQLGQPVNRSLLNELVVRQFTHKILTGAFGTDFADWFSARESSIEVLIQNQEVISKHSTDDNNITL